MNSPFLLGPPTQHKVPSIKEEPKRLVPQKIKHKSVLIDAINNTKSGVKDHVNKSDDIIKVRQNSEEEKEESKGVSLKLENKESND